MKKLLRFIRFSFYSRKTKTLNIIYKDETMNDVGIYLAFGKNGYFRLPLTETFHLQEISPGKLHATHRMHIFKLPFLKITYNIMQNKGST